MQEQPDPPKAAISVGKYIILGLATVVASIGLIVLCGYFSLIVMFNGGIDGLIRNMKPAPNLSSSEMNTTRAAARAEIEQSFTELQNTLHYHYYETATHDFCSKGDNNYKRSDGYAYRCSLRITTFYGFNGDFRQEMLAFEQKIHTLGWSGLSSDEPNPTKDMLEKSYDHYTEYRSGEIIVSNLPNWSCRYGKDGLSIGLGFAQKETSIFDLIDSLQEVGGHSYDDIYDQRSFQDSSLLIKKITDTDRYVLVIAIQKDYFQN